MAITLVSDEYDEIRLLVGGDIDEEDLSDARINGGTVLGAAESYALRRIPSGQNGLNYSRGDVHTVGRYCIGTRGFWCRRSLSRFKTPQDRYRCGTRGHRWRNGKRFSKRKWTKRVQRLVDAGHGVEADGFAPAVAVFTVN